MRKHERRQCLTMQKYYNESENIAEKTDHNENEING